MTSRHPRSTRPTDHSPAACVLIVEDDSSVAHEIAEALVAIGYEAGGVASSVPEALDLLSERVPDVALVDVQLAGGESSAGLAADLRDKHGVPVVCLVAHFDNETVARLKEASPASYVARPFETGRLRLAIELALHNAAAESARRRELAGEKAKLHELDARIALLEARLREIAGLVADPAGEGAPPEVGPSFEERFRGLSRREIEIVRMLSEGRRVAAIARELDLSVHTVRNHLRAIFRKLELHSQEELLDAVRGVSFGSLGRS